RQLPEQRPVLVEALGDDPLAAGRRGGVEEETVGVLAVAVVVVAGARRPRLARSVLEDRGERELPRQMDDAADHQAVALRATRAAVLRFHVGRIVRIAGGKLRAEV